MYSISKYLFLFQEIPECHNEACKIGMSATNTAIGGTIANISGALCPLSFRFGCANFEPSW